MGTSASAALTTASASPCILSLRFTPTNSRESTAGSSPSGCGETFITAAKGRCFFDSLMRICSQAVFFHPQSLFHAETSIFGHASFFRALDSAAAVQDFRTGGRRRGPVPAVVVRRPGHPRQQNRSEDEHPSADAPRLPTILRRLHRLHRDVRATHQLAERKQPHEGGTDLHRSHG